LKGWRKGGAGGYNAEVIVGVIDFRWTTEIQTEWCRVKNHYLQYKEVILAASKI
jgi:hypothetical protein